MKSTRIPKYGKEGKREELTNNQLQEDWMSDC